MGRVDLGANVVDGSYENVIRVLAQGDVDQDCVNFEAEVVGVSCEKAGDVLGEIDRDESPVHLRTGMDVLEEKMLLDV